MPESAPANPITGVISPDNEAVFRTVFNNLPQKVFYKDDSLVYQAANPSYTQDLHITPEEIIGKKDDELFPRELAERYQASDRRVILSGAAEEYDDVYILAGQKRTIHRVRIPIRGQAGGVDGILGIIWDITDRTNVEEEMFSLAQRYHALYENSPVSLWEEDFSGVKRRIDALKAQGVLDFQQYFQEHPEVITDCIGEIKVLDANFATLRLYGASTQSDLMRSLQRIFGADMVPLMTAELLAIAADQTTFEGEGRNNTLDGRTIDVFMRWSVAPGCTDTLARVFISITDITDRKRAEAFVNQAREKLEVMNRELKIASEVKSQFLANMSHEIRTPLNAIIGMTSLLLDTSLTQEQTDFADTIRSSGEVLLSLINDILDFSKIEAQKMELESQSFNLRHCIEEALDLICPKASEKGLDLAYVVDGGVPNCFFGDVTRLRQVLVNLLGNSVKFTATGEVVITVQGQIQDNNRWLLHFMIHDTGLGIPPDRQDRLFQSFNQVDASTTRRYGGTGLGLAISKKLSEIMGGSMWVESSGVQGEGSTFHFTVLIPAAQDDETVRENQLTVDLSSKKVLIVDDNLTNRKIVIGYTKTWSMLPTAVASGREALDLLQAGERFDLAILDYQMPEMDGLTLADEISRLLRDTPMDLVLLSSLGFRDAGAKQRIAAYLTKPIKPSQLHDVLVGVVSKGKVTPQKLETSSQFDREMGARHPLRILLAEDNLVNQKVALSLLMRIGYRADLAANGIEVLQALNRQEYDVVLMDGQMPEMDGEEATRQIRRDLPPAQQPHIVAMTANAMKGDRERYLAAGMDDYVSKPIRLEELVRALSGCKPLSAETKPTPADPSSEPEVTDDPVERKPCIDPAVLASFVEMIGEGGEDLAREITSMYIRDVPRLIQEMEQAIAANDAELLRRSAHTLKGNSNQVGAVQLAELSLDLEQLAKTGSVEDTGLLNQIRKEFTRVEVLLGPA